MDKRKKKEKGITLVALVITIIILLIIAGITINLTMGQNGIIIKAERAGKNYTNAVAYENEVLSELLGKQEKVEEVEEPDKPENVSNLYLYYRGKEYEEITGGWKEGQLAGGNDTVGEVKKYEKYVEVNTWGYWCTYGIATENSIDVTEYWKLKVEIFDCEWEDVSGYEQIVLTCQEKQIIVYRDDLQDGIYELDINDIDGQASINVQIGNGAKGKIKAVWLEKQPESLYLYNRGEENVNETGGWQVGYLAGTDESVGKAEKKEEYIEVETWGYWGVFGMITQKTVNVTGYSKLKVEIFDCTWEEISGYEQVALTCQGISEIIYRDEIVDKVYEMDISNITGLSNINVAIGNGANGKIRAVWLEK